MLKYNQIITEGIKMKKKKLSPYIIIALSFLIVILIGTILLKLPITTTQQPLSWMDAFFTATSMITITGIMPVSNVGVTFTLFGKIVIASLIQIGGLSILTLTMYMLVILGAKINVNNRTLLKENLNYDSLQGIVKLLRRIVVLTLSIELIGIIINLFIFIPNMTNLGEAIGVSIFHAISSFNNAGVDILGVTEHISHFKDNVLFNINTLMLVILGGLGTMVIYDLINKRRWKKLTIHSKIVVKMTLLLLIIGMLLVKLFEGNQVTWLEALFMSGTSRTAGFMTLNIHDLRNATIAIVMMLMFIGAGPMSTGGGIKITTFYVLIKSIFSFGRGKKTITHKRYISDETKIKSFILAQASILFIAMVSILLLAIENIGFKEAIFNTMSVLSNTGLMIGNINEYKDISKFIIIVTMYIGRVGPLTILHLIYSKSAKQSIVFIEEKLIIG